MIRIGHISDMHGHVQRLEGLERPDVWVISGDFFPNRQRPIYADEQERYQRGWFRRKAKRILAALGDVPVVWIDGNHDFVCLVELLKGAGKENCHKVTPEGVMVLGLRFSGFRQVPAMCYEWAGETMDFGELIDRTFASNPDILVTHAPAQGMLDDNGDPRFDYGIPGLANKLCWQPHNIQAHCHGHAHNDGGKVVEEMGMKISNAAEHVNFFEV